MSDAQKVHWRDRPLLTIKEASAIAGVSIVTVYRQAKAERLTLKSLSGRTMVDTNSLAAFLDTAEDWKPAARTAPMLAKRSSRSLASERSK